MTAGPGVHTQTPFDAAAVDYDAAFEQNPVTRRIRSVVRGTLLEHFRPGSNVLELNCGTGTDAIALAEHGVRVTGIDSSAGMISCARSKIAASGLGHLVTCRELDFHDIDSMGGMAYDGAYSNFGGLNCSSRFREVIGKLAGLLKPGSVFVACLLNRTCLWEIAGFLARGKFEQAFRRFGAGGTDVPVGGLTLHVWYHSPAGMGKILSPWFEVSEIYGLNIFSPSPNSRNFASSHPVLTESLLRLDAKVRSAIPFRSLGDHFVVVARRGSA